MIDFKGSQFEREIILWGVGGMSRIRFPTAS
jgi:hypothetical protein